MLPCWLRESRICLLQPLKVGKIPWRRKWLPTVVFLSGESHGRRSLVGHSPWGRQEFDTTEQLTDKFTEAGRGVRIQSRCFWYYSSTFTDSEWVINRLVAMYFWEILHWTKLIRFSSEFPRPLRSKRPQSCMWLLSRHLRPVDLCDLPTDCFPLLI